MSAVEFNNKVLIIGYGAVSRCTLPILLDKIRIPYENITIIDFEDKSEELKDYTQKGVSFFQKKVTPEELGNILSDHLSPGGLCIDLAWNIDCCEIVKWCHDHEVLYVNTSLEEWSSYEGRFSKYPKERSLYNIHMRLRELTKCWKDSTTCVVDHGANPGLISHFAKQGLLDIAKRMIRDRIAKDAGKMKQLIKDNKFNELAMEVGIKVIHCSERDTQISHKPKEEDEFVNTWSIAGLREEATAPAEIGWGTHEKELPDLAYAPKKGPKNQIMIAEMGMNTKVRSWIPHHEIVGMLIRHSEAFGISDRWTVWRDGKPVYRPTVHYAYMPCEHTIVSLHELRTRNYEMQSKLRIIDDNEITSGADILGALLMGHPYNSWWTGSILSIEESRKLVPGQNATTIQVALGVVTAVLWMIENPRKGFCLPDDLPHKFVLGIAKPYLGEFYSGASDWTPLKHMKRYSEKDLAGDFDEEDVWQFKNFVLNNGAIDLDEWIDIHRVKPRRERRPAQAGKNIRQTLREDMIEEEMVLDGLNDPSIDGEKHGCPA